MYESTKLSPLVPVHPSPTLGVFTFSTRSYAILFLTRLISFARVSYLRFVLSSMQLLMCGTGNISVNDLKKNHNLAGFGRTFRKVREEIRDFSLV